MIYFSDDTLGAELGIAFIYRSPMTYVLDDLFEAKSIMFIYLLVFISYMITLSYLFFLFISYLLDYIPHNRVIHTVFFFTD